MSPTPTPRERGLRGRFRLGRWLASVLRRAPTEREAAAPPRGVEADPALEARVQEIGRAWLVAAREAGAGAPGLFGNTLIERALGEHAFKVQLFRFVDVFPMLRSAALAHEVLVDYFTTPGVTLPPGFEL